MKPPSITAASAGRGAKPAAAPSGAPIAIPPRTVPAFPKPNFGRRNRMAPLVIAIAAEFLARLQLVQDDADHARVGQLQLFDGGLHARLSLAPRVDDHHHARDRL